MEEKKDLQRELGRIAGKYSNTKYLTLTNDYGFNRVPDKLHSLWSSPTGLSIFSLERCETLTQQDLESLEEQLHDEFKKLRKITYCN